MRYEYFIITPQNNILLPPVIYGGFGYKRADRCVKYYQRI